MSFLDEFSGLSKKLIHAILSGMGYDFYSKGVCWLHVDEVYSITPGSEADERIA